MEAPVPLLKIVNPKEVEPVHKKHKNSVSVKQIKKERIDIRDLHRDPDYEDPISLADQQSILLAEIKQLNKENKLLTQYMYKKEHEYTEFEESDIIFKQMYTIDPNIPGDQKRVLDHTARLKELSTLQKELDNELLFIRSYFSIDVENTLMSDCGFEKNEILEAHELNEAVNAKLKAVKDILNGPKLRQARQTFFAQKRQIKDLKSELRKLIKMEKKISDEYDSLFLNEHSYQDLYTQKAELKHQLAVLKHRHYLKTNELEQENRKYSNHEDSVLLTHVVTTIDDDYEVKERERFRKTMTKRKQEQDRKLREMYFASKNNDNQDEEQPVEQEAKQEQQEEDPDAIRIGDDDSQEEEEEEEKIEKQSTIKEAPVGSQLFAITQNKVYDDGTE